MPNDLTTKSGRKIRMDSPEDDAAITAAALSDPDALPLTDEEMEAMRKKPEPAPATSETPRLRIGLKDVSREQFAVAVQEGRQGCE